jgi:hypothetical protein
MFMALLPLAVSSAMSPASMPKEAQAYVDHFALTRMDYGNFFKSTFSSVIEDTHGLPARFEGGNRVINSGT